MLNELITELAKSNDGRLNAIRKFFDERGSLAVLDGKSCSFKAKSWPKVPGVYVVRKIGSGDIIYIGMTGALTRNSSGEIGLGGGILSKRAARWDPYFFNHDPGVLAFEYGPNFAPRNKKPKPSKSNYLEKFSFSEISIDCYCLGQAGAVIAPAFLESLMLQSFISENKFLPPANNKF